MIKSKRFKALLKARRQFIVRDPSQFQFGEYGPRVLVENYLKKYDPDRLDRYEKNMYLLKLCSTKLEVHSMVFKRYNELVFLSSVGHILKALYPYPDLLFSRKAFAIERRDYLEEAKCAPEIYRSHLISKFPKDEKVTIIEMPVQRKVPAIEKKIVNVSYAKMVVTSKFFKVIEGARKVRKFELIYAWIYCVELPFMLEPAFGPAYLIRARDFVKDELSTEYHNNPIVFKLLNQIAKLLLP